MECVTMVYRLLIMCLLIACWSTGVGAQQTPTPAIPFADAPLPTLLTLLPEDARAAVCNASLRDSFWMHLVRPGDTLPALMTGHDEYTITELAIFNCLDDPSALPIGAAIFLPAGAVYERTLPRDPLALLALARFRLTMSTDCPYAWLPGAGAPRCPEHPPTRVYAAWQPFQRGLMLWLSDVGTITVMYADGTFAVYTDTWQEGMPEASVSAPPGLYAPVRGFRRVWDVLGGGGGDLGWAIAPEQGFDSARQPAGRSSFTTYIALPDERTLALTDLPSSVYGVWVALR
jgi:hypothetical protein